MNSEKSSKAICQILEDFRRKLLDTGTRNRLVHVNRTNQRANCLNVVNERSDEIYSILRSQGKQMRFKAGGKDRTAEDGDMSLAGFEESPDPGRSRSTSNSIDTPLGPEALARRLLRLARDAKTAEEEQGVNILYLAMGFLRWRESVSSEVQREAPLVLLPVQLKRNERTSTYDIRCRDDDITVNLPLSERLRQDFGIALPEIEESDEWTPSAYFDGVNRSVSGQRGWSIDKDGMQLGFFSFAKLLMHHDLDPEKWPKGFFSDSPLIKGLLIGGFPAGEPIFGAEDKLDEKLHPRDIVQVIDADASQTKVIEEVRRGSSLVVQGPPGTGKSQTITNIIAAAAHDGKTVLFVAEKMAALSVVHGRLKKSGLQHICIELHSRSANKRVFAQELGGTLMASGMALPHSPDPDRLAETRDELNRIAELLHTPVRGVADTPFQALSTLIGFTGREVPPPLIPLDGLKKIDRDGRDKSLSEISKFIAALGRVGSPEDHPFRGTKELELQPMDISRLELELNRSVQDLASLSGFFGTTETTAKALERWTMTGIRTLSDVICSLNDPFTDPVSIIREIAMSADRGRPDKALVAGRLSAEASSTFEWRFTPLAWTTDLATIRPALVRGRNSWFWRLFRGYRRASARLASLVSGPIPETAGERISLLDEIGKAQTWRIWIGNLLTSGALSSAAHLVQLLEAVTDPERTSTALTAAVDACLAGAAAPIARLKLDLGEAGLGADPEETALSEMLTAFRRMAANPNKYSDWSDYKKTREAVEMTGAASIPKAILEGRLKAEKASDEFLLACAEARWNAARKYEPGLQDLSRLDRHELVRVFRDLEQEQIDTAKNKILSRHFEQMPRGTTGEMRIIRGEIGRKARHKPVRWVVKNAGSMLQRIKPVMLMSPISVAQFLPPESVSFDLLVVDEASQIRPEDALGAIARAKQVVVVGDQKQLPPTSFFDRLVDEVDDDDEDALPPGVRVPEMESILSLCEAGGLRQRMLEWHYRSRDQSLIQVSNAEFYNNRLVLPPSPLQMDPEYGLKFTPVAGVYAKGAGGPGRKGTNRIEAEAVAKAVAGYAQVQPNLSLGVVAFSKAQADMLTEVLEMQRRTDPVLDDFLREGKAEDVFVKNIENVQGDERDVILISVGYGPQEPNGRLATQNFGPVNREGGERRLNVLFSRARLRCEVFASFDPGDINPRSVARDGPRILKRFLEFAKTGKMDQTVSTGRDADSPFEEDVARVIRSLGYLADPQVGTAGFRIDIGVRHADRPGQYLVAVECDGAAYHSALWARERDRLRQGILENLGWRFYRIWSTDWFYNRAREIGKLEAALKNARESSSEGIEIEGSNSGGEVPVAPTDEPDSNKDPDFPHLVLRVPAYVRSNHTINSSLEPHEAPLDKLSDLVTKIVEVEGPIHKGEIAKRVARAFGRSRRGRRIVDATEKAIQSAAGRGQGLKKKGPFVFTESQLKDPPVRDRSKESGTSLLNAENLSAMEIVAAEKLIVRESGEMPPEEMTKAVANLLGYKRVGADLSNAITKALKQFRH